MSQKFLYDILPDSLRRLADPSRQNLRFFLRKSASRLEGSGKILLKLFAGHYTRQKRVPYPIHESIPTTFRCDPGLISQIRVGAGVTVIMIESQLVNHVSCQERLALEFAGGP